MAQTKYLGKNYMNKILGFLLLTITSTQSLAENMEISLFSGYRTGGEMDNASTGNKVKFDESNSYGVIIGSDYGPEHVMEFLYSNQSTGLRDNSTVPSTKLLNVEIEYFQLGGSQLWVDEKVDKFFGGTLGTIRIDPDNSSYSATSKFAMTFGGGVVFKLSNNIGLRLEARGYFASMGSSSTFCGNNNQCVVVGDGFMQQFDVNAGLRVRF